MILIIILNYNNYFLTEKCIHSIINQQISKKIVVVDNNSNDCSYQYLKEKFPELDIIKTNKNIGYARGNNYGINYGIKYNPNYICIINSDVFLEPNFFPPIINKFKENKKIAAITPKIYNNDGLIQNTTTRKIPNFKTLLLNNLYLIEILTNKLKIKFKDLSDYYYSDYDWKECSQIEVLSGACFVIDANFFKQIGYFDENTFLFSEENIIGWKIKKSNKIIYTQPESKALHIHSVTINKFPKIKIKFIMLKSHKYFLKNYLKINPIRIIIFQALILFDYFLVFLPVQLVKYLIIKVFHNKSTYYD